MTSNDFKVKLLPYNQKLYRLCLRFVLQQQEAEDIVQEVYLKLWNIRDKLEDINNLEAFSSTMAKNLCLDRLRLKRGRMTLDLDALLSNSKSITLDPQQQTENTDNYRIIKKIIDHLPEQQKFIIKLREIDELSFEEIEKITGLSINNIRVCLSRARNSIKNELIRIHEYGTDNKRSSKKIL